MERVGIAPVRLLALTKFLLKGVPRLWIMLWEHGDTLDPTDSLHESLSRIFFQRMITATAGKEVTFMIPRDLDDLTREL